MLAIELVKMLQKRANVARTHRGGEALRRSTRSPRVVMLRRG
jgi:hypothetical protein